MSRPRVGVRACVIGAGASGLCATKALLERGIAVDCYEISDRVGGNWAYRNPNGLSAAYRSLVVNTSKRVMQFADFPFPDEWPPYPGHEQIFQYLNDYADHFDVRRHIRFKTEVKSVVPLAEGWRVTLADGSEHDYDAVLVANGHHFKPKWPSYEGTFTGRQMHAHEYLEPAGFEGKNVVVVGIGSSGVDIACELSRVAATTWLSTRRGTHVIPKFVAGKPVDQLATGALQAVMTRLPHRITRTLAEKTLERYRGKVSDYGLPAPDHRLFQAQPTVNEELPSLVQHGRVKMKPGIRELRGDRVVFVDGSEERVDVLIYATGYFITFPFLPPEVIDPGGENEVRLYRHVVDPHRPGLFFIGLLQVIGSVFPLAEAQGVWVAKLLRGEAHLPPQDEMEAAIDRDIEKMAKRYIRASRHTVQVDPHPYLRLLRSEMRR